ncbi:MAG: hypothetical protein EOO99_00535 [Pedobacter sp.]|nr:MAG: hypothetical protein EOO99_00535 [Pedobacter sp.]
MKKRSWISWNVLKNSCLIAIICLGFPLIAQSQNVFESGLRMKMDSLINEKGTAKHQFSALLPNNSVQSIMTPTGWGGGNSTYAFVVLGGVYPAMYTEPNTGDLAGAFGISGGNSSKFINVSASMNVVRVSEFRDLSMNLVVSRQIIGGTSISAGALHLFASPSVSDAPDASYYLAISHASQKIKSRSEGYSGLSYTLGYGTGRFRYKSPMDEFTGKGKYGTGFFANISYEIIRQVNFNLEWSGLNLGVSSGIRPIKGSAFTFGFGVFNLTKFSGDRIQLFGTVGYPVLLNKRSKVN